MAIQDDKFLPTSNVAKRRDVLALDSVIAVSQTNRVIQIIQPGYEFLLQLMSVYARVYAAVVTIVAYVVQGNQLFGAAPTVAAGTSTASKYKTALFEYMLAGVHLIVAAAEHVWSTNFVVSANKFGGVLIQADSSGVLSTKVVGTPQAYDTAVQALANVPAPDAGKIAVSRVTIAAGGGDFTANTTATTGLLTTHDAVPVAAAATVVPIAAKQVNSAVPTTAAGWGGESDSIVIAYTSDGSGDITDSFLTVIHRPFPLNGEISRETATN